MVFPFLFLVGTNVGDISLWEVGSRERLAHKPFKVWDISAASMPLQVLYQLPVGITDSSFLSTLASFPLWL